MSGWELFSAKVHAEGVHRSGWPYIRKELAKRSTPGAKWVLLDFADMQFRGMKQALVRPWVGIFHYPASVDSPIPQFDKRCLVHTLFSKRVVTASMRHMRGAIAMSAALREALDGIIARRVPILPMSHPTEWEPAKNRSIVSSSLFPTELGVREWRGTPRTIAQVGYFLRDTRAIFKVRPKPGWQRHRFTPWMDWMSSRDRELIKAGDSVPEIDAPSVVEIPRLSNEAYDDVLTSALVVSWVHAAEANNVVVECLARCTPLLINYHPSVAEYLGEDYPLYMRTKRDLADCLYNLTDADFTRASQYMRKRRDASPWLSVDKFCDDVNAAIVGLQEAHKRGEKFSR